MEARTLADEAWQLIADNENRFLDLNGRICPTFGCGQDR